MTIITAISNEKGPFIPPIFEELLISSLNLYERKKKRWLKGSNAFRIIPQLTHVKVVGENLLRHIYPFPTVISFSEQTPHYCLENMLQHLEDDPYWTNQIWEFIKRYRLTEKYIKRFFYLAFRSLKSLIPKRQILKFTPLVNPTKKPAILNRALYRDGRKVIFENEEELERGQIRIFERLYLSVESKHYLIESLPLIDTMPSHIENKVHQWQWLIDFLNTQFKDFTLFYL